MGAANVVQGFTVGCGFVKVFDGMFHMKMVSFFVFYIFRFSGFRK